MLIYIEGNIACGKSTFTRMLSSHIDAEFVQEPVEEWIKTTDRKGVNILDKFYKDPHKWAFPFQMNTFITRIRKISNIPNNKLCFVERSVFTDKYCFAKNLYETGFLDDIEWDLYCSWFDWLTNTFKVRPCAYIYLRTTPTVSFNRLIKRSRNEECAVTQDYLTELYQKHEDWLTGKESVLTIDVTEDFEHNPSRFNTILEQVKSFITSLPS